jgi:hypothetical protein
VILAVRKLIPSFISVPRLVNVDVCLQECLSQQHVVISVTAFIDSTESCPLIRPNCALFFGAFLACARRPAEVAE